jgi:hypothetical protein
MTASFTFREEAERKRGREEERKRGREEERKRGREEERNPGGSPVYIICVFSAVVAKVAIGQIHGRDARAALGSRSCHCGRIGRSSATIRDKLPPLRLSSSPNRAIVPRD